MVTRTHLNFTFIRTLPVLLVSKTWMSATNTLPTSLVWLLAQCVVSLGTLRRHSFFFLFAQCVVFNVLGRPSGCYIELLHWTSNFLDAGINLYGTLAAAGTGLFVVVCLRSMSGYMSLEVVQLCPSGWHIWHTQTHTHTHIYIYIYIYIWGTRWRIWLRHCATSREVAGSIPDGVIGIFHWHNPF